MLKLSRKIGESILIDEKVFITCLGVSDTGEWVLGFDAPRHIPIDRLEVRLDKKKSGERTKSRTTNGIYNKGGEINVK